MIHRIFVAITVVLAITSIAKADNFNSINVTNGITAGGTITAAGNIVSNGDNIRATAGYIKAQTYFQTPGYIQANGAGSSIYSLTIPQWLVVGTTLTVGTDKLVVASDGSITMSKVQGDIAMGQFGNP